MTWKEFRPRGGGTGRALKKQVSVSKGTVCIAPELITENWPDGYGFIQVFVNEEEGRIGLAASKDKGYKLRQPDTGKAFQIVLTSLIKEYGIARGRYPAEWDEEEGLLIFEPDFEEAEV